MPILAALAERGSRREGRRQAEPVAHDGERGAASRRVEGTAVGHARRGRARRDVPARMRDALRVRAPPRRGVRRVAADARAVPRGPHDRGAVRAPVGEPARRPRRTASARARSTCAASTSPPIPTACSMHGNLRGARVRRRARRGRRRPARTSSPGSTTAPAPDLLRAFPFPHVVTIDAPARRARAAAHHRHRADRPHGGARSRSAGTRSCSSPARPRASWELRWPACERVLVDERDHPDRRARRATGRARRRSAIGRSTITTRSAPTAASRCAAAGRQLELRFGPTYPFAQLYVPARGNFAAIEPMTAHDRRARPRHRPARRTRATASARGSRSRRSAAVTLRLLPGRRAHRLPRRSSACPTTSTG